MTGGASGGAPCEGTDPRAVAARGPRHVALGEFVSGSELLAAPTFSPCVQSLLPSHPFSVLQLSAFSSLLSLLGFLANINMR